MTMLEIAAKPVFGWKDISTLFGVKRSRAFELMSQCRAIWNGAVPFRSGTVNAARFFEMMGIDRAEYLRSLGKSE